MSNGALSQAQPYRPGRAILRRLLRHPGGFAGALITLCFFAIALLAPWLSPYDPLAQDLNRRLQGPSRAHLLGTDDFGRDILSRVMHGARISLTIGFVSVGIAVAGGLGLGLVAGFYTAGRWGRLIDTVTMRSSDILLAFPAVLLAIGALGLLAGAGAFLFFRKKKTPPAIATAEPEETVEPEEPKRPPLAPVESADATLPDDLREVLRIIEKGGGRITQLDLRKGLPYSEAKVSLMVTDLESRGIVKKIKKGRGNVIILNRPGANTEAD